MNDSGVHMNSDVASKDVRRTNPLLNHTSSSKVYVAPALRLKQQWGESAPPAATVENGYGSPYGGSDVNGVSSSGYPSYPAPKKEPSRDSTQGVRPHAYRPPQVRMRQDEENSMSPGRQRYAANHLHAHDNRTRLQSHAGTPRPSNDRYSVLLEGTHHRNAPTSRSVTKTEWDVRGGRRYHQENEKEVFASSKAHTGINFDTYDDIPVELTGHGAEAIGRIDNFQSTDGIHELLSKNVKRVNYSRPTPVQRHAIPVILNGRDLMACAQTGSGKTAAFLFPVVSLMLQLGPPPPLEHSHPVRRESAAPVCLVLSPTRELAVQIFQEARKFAFGTGIRTCVLYGGSDVKTQMFDLDKGCDICVATPGRLKDLMDRRKVKLACVRHLVLDEADRMLDMGFLPQMKEIAFDSDMPHSNEGRQTVMFSATFPREVQQLARDFLKNYIFLSVGRVGSTNNFIRQRLQYASDDKKLVFLMKLLKENSGGLTLIFVETKRKADQIEGVLINEDFHAVSIHGDRSQMEREEALQLFKDGKYPILVATDVAARGLDIPNIMHVINLDIPNNIDDYVHRIGRTGRAGNKGLATSFVNENNWPVFRDLLNILEESSQEVPSWFQSLVMDTTGGGRGGGRGRGRGGNHFGGGGRFIGSKDVRNGHDVVSYNHGKGAKITGSNSIPTGNGRMGTEKTSHGFENDMNSGYRDDAW